MRLLLLVSVTASLIAAAPAAAAPTIAFVDGKVQIAGTAGADDFTVQADDATHVLVRLNSGTWTQSEDSVCAAFNEWATCDELPAPVEVVADLGAGADTFTVGPGAAALRSVTATYASAPAAITYAGPSAGGPATIATSGATDTFTRVDRLVGSAFGDTLTGGDTAETLAGGGGDDTIDVARGGGPGDAVDCGDGVDRVSFRGGVDTQAGCEILNGIDTRGRPTDPPAVAPNPMPFVPPPAFGPPALPPLSNPQLTSGSAGAIDVRVTCQLPSCVGQPVVLEPPPPNLGSGLPTGWEHLTDDPYFQDPQIAALLRELANRALTESDLKQERRDIDAARRRLREARQMLIDAADRARREAAIRQMEAQLALQKALLQAALQQGLRPVPDRMQQDLEQMLNHLHDVPTPLDKRKQTPASKVHRASAAAAGRVTRKSFTRWLLARTATALPTIRTKLQATSTPGVYRAKLRAPRWLRATSRVLRKGRVKTLPVDLRLGGATVRVALPLPR